MATDWPAMSYEQWRRHLRHAARAHPGARQAGRRGSPRPSRELQHAALRLTARGWETAPLPAPDGSGALVVALDLRVHEAVVEHSDGRAERVALTPDRPVGEVTREVLAAVRGLGGPGGDRPDAAGGAVERAARRGRRARALRPCPGRPTTSPPPPRPRWCSRRSARPIAAARRRSTPGGARSTWPSACSPASPPIRRRRTSSCATRWTPRRSRSAGGPVTPATPRRRSTPTRTRHRQASPAPASPRRPRTGTAALGEYILDWDDVRTQPDPHAVALEFARSAFRHACAVCDWDPALAASADANPPPVS